MPPSRRSDNEMTIFELSQNYKNTQKRPLEKNPIPGMGTIQGFWTYLKMVLKRNSTSMSRTMRGGVMRGPPVLVINVTQFIEPVRYYINYQVKNVL